VTVMDMRNLEAKYIFVASCYHIEGGSADVIRQQQQSITSPMHNSKAFLMRIADAHRIRE